MRSPFLTALFHPLNMLMIALSIFAGLVSAWWLFPVGLIFWLIMVLTVSRDRALQFNAQLQRREPLAQRFQPHFDHVQRAQVRVFNTIASSPPRIQRILKPIQSEVDGLVESVYALCQRMTVLENYRVVTQSQSRLTADLDRINRQVEETENPLLRQGYLDSQRALQERVAKLESVAVQLDRIDAFLLSVVNDMDSIVTELVRLQAVAPDEAEAQVVAVVGRLHDEIMQMQNYERQAVRV